MIVLLERENHDSLFLSFLIQEVREREREEKKKEREKENELTLVLMGIQLQPHLSASVNRKKEIERKEMNV